MNRLNSNSTPAARRPLQLKTRNLHSHASQVVADQIVHSAGNYGNYVEQSYELYLDRTADPLDLMAGFSTSRQEGRRSPWKRRSWPRHSTRRCTEITRSAGSPGSIRTSSVGARCGRV